MLIVRFCDGSRVIVWPKFWFNIFYLDFSLHVCGIVGCAEKISYICRLRL